MCTRDVGPFLSLSLSLSLQPHHHPTPHTHTPPTHHHTHDTSQNQLVLYWGQNSYGATHSDVANFQKRLAFYCGAGAESVTDTFPLAFLTTFFGEGGLPSLDLSNVSRVSRVGFAERRLNDPY